MKSPRKPSSSSAGSLQSFFYGPYVVLALVAMLFVVLYVSFNFRVVSRSQEADHTTEIMAYKKAANDARKELSKWMRGIEEKDIVIKDLEYKLAAAKRSRDEYMEALKIKDDQLSKIAGHKNPRG